MLHLATLLLLLKAYEMNLAEKLKHLRYVEGVYRGLNRSLTKAEVLRAMREELGASLSHAYLSQLENGNRTHMSPGTRQQIATFFKVHPGYLISDPEGYQPSVNSTEMLSGIGSYEASVQSWLLNGAVIVDDIVTSRALRRLAAEPQPERYLRLLHTLLQLSECELQALEQHGTIKMEQNDNGARLEDI